MSLGTGYKLKCIWLLQKPHGTEHLESHTVERPAAPHKQSTNSKAPAAANKPAATVDKSPQNQKDNKNKVSRSTVTTACGIGQLVACL